MKRQTLLATLALAASALAPLAANADPYDHTNDGMHGMHGMRGRDRTGRPVQRGGQIASVNGGSFRLDDGTTIFLNTTSIDPSGVRLQPGERVQISGTEAGNGAINASSVNVVGGFRHRRY